MRTVTFWRWSLGLALAVLPLAGGCDQESANSAPADSAATNLQAGADTAPGTNAPAPEAVEQELDQAPGQVVSTASAPPPGVALSHPANEVAKLAEAGVPQSVMLSFVTNSPNMFNLSSDAIVYLNDLGVPGDVVTSMLQHDLSLKQTAVTYSAGQPGTAPLIAPPGTSSAYAPSPAPAATAEAAPLTPPPAEEAQGAPAPESPNVSYTYFYDSLSPYGSWINVNGYGLCWQPTAVVANPGWQPYCDNGRWAYTDCGWCWVSSYSWGWAPFHYGRWFHHRRWGWCWAPDTVWGPAWVSWRYGQSYCGWAPLPPAACYTPGIGFTYFGRHVGFGFGFGLSIGAFTFVGFDHFDDRHWRDHRVPSHQVGAFYNRTVIANRVVERNRTIINEGIPVSRVSAAMHREIPRVRISDARNPVGARFEPVGGSKGVLAVYRPSMPAPAVRGPARLVGEGVAPNPGFRSPGLRNAETARNSVEPRAAIHYSPAAQPQAQAHPGSAGGVQTRGSAGSVPPIVQHSWQHPAASAAQPGAPAQNGSRVFVQPYEQPQYHAQSPAPQQEQGTRVFRQDSPKYNEQQQAPVNRAVSRPQPQQATRSYQWAPAAEPREQQQRFLSPRQSSEQPSYQAPRVSSGERIQAAPPSQPSRSAPAPSHGANNFYSRHN